MSTYSDVGFGLRGSNDTNCNKHGHFVPDTEYWCHHGDLPELSEESTHRQIREHRVVQHSSLRAPAHSNVGFGLSKMPVFMEMELPVIVGVFKNHLDCLN